MKTDYKKEISGLIEGMSTARLRQVLEFVNFLRTREKGFSYKTVADSAEYVRKLRSDETAHMKSGGEFIKELIRWQESNSL